MPISHLLLLNVILHPLKVRKNTTNGLKIDIVLGQGCN